MDRHPHQQSGYQHHHHPHDGGGGQFDDPAVDYEVQLAIVAQAQAANAQALAALTASTNALMSRVDRTTTMASSSAAASAAAGSLSHHRGIDLPSTSSASRSLSMGLTDPTGGGGGAWAGTGGAVVRHPGEALAAARMGPYSMIMQGNDDLAAAAVADDYARSLRQQQNQPPRRGEEVDDRSNDRTTTTKIAAHGNGVGNEDAGHMQTPTSNKLLAAAEKGSDVAAAAAGDGGSANGVHADANKVEGSTTVVAAATDVPGASAGVIASAGTANPPEESSDSARQYRPSGGEPHASGAGQREDGTSTAPIEIDGEDSSSSAAEDVGVGATKGDDGSDALMDEDEDEDEHDDDDDLDEEDAGDDDEEEEVLQGGEVAAVVHVFLFWGLGALGLTVEEDAENRCFVDSIKPGGQAETLGVRSGDCIVSAARVHPNEAAAGGGGGHRRELGHREASAWRTWMRFEDFIAVARGGHRPVRVTVMREAASGENATTGGGPRYRHLAPKAVRDYAEYVAEHSSASSSDGEDSPSLSSSSPPSSAASSSSSRSPEEDDDGHHDGGGATADLYRDVAAAAMQEYRYTRETNSPSSRDEVEGAVAVGNEQWDEDDDDYYDVGGGNDVKDSDDEGAYDVDASSSSSASTSPSPTWRCASTPLAMPDDRSFIPELQCYLRSDVLEAFGATRDDVRSFASRSVTSRRRPTVVGHVGVRCRFCRGKDWGEGEGHGVVFAASIDALVRQVFSRLFGHVHVCAAVPPEVRSNLGRHINETVASPGRAGANKSACIRYWIEAARRLGLTEDGYGIGIWFERDPEVCRKEATEAMESAREELEEEGSSLRLVFARDRPLIAEEVYVAIQQMYWTTLREADQKGCFRHLAVGFPGLACKHCIGRQNLNNKGRWFPPSEKSIQQTSTGYLIMHHLRNCDHCPEEIREKIKTLQEQKGRYKKSGRPQHGGRKIFWHRVWCRMHRLEHEDEEDEDNGVQEQEAESSDDSDASEDESDEEDLFVSPYSDIVDAVHAAFVALIRKEQSESQDNTGSAIATAEPADVGMNLDDVVAGDAKMHRAMGDVHASGSSGSAPPDSTGMGEPRLDTPGIQKSDENPTSYSGKGDNLSIKGDGEVDAKERKGLSARLRRSEISSLNSAELHTVLTRVGHSPRPSHKKRRLSEVENLFVDKPDGFELILDSDSRGGSNVPIADKKDGNALGGTAEVPLDQINNTGLRGQPSTDEGSAMKETNSSATRENQSCMKGQHSDQVNLRKSNVVSSEVASGCPDGWIKRTHKTPSGRKYPLWCHSETGKTCRSLAEVQRYLKASTENLQQPVEYAGEERPSKRAKNTPIEKEEETPQEKVAKSVSLGKQVAKSVTPQKQVTKRVSPRKQTAKYVKSVSPRKQASKSVMSVSPRRQAAKSVMSVSPRKQVAKSVKSVSPRKLADKSVKSISPRKQVAKSVKSISTRKQAAKSVKSVSPRKQAVKSVNSVSTRKQATKSVKSVSPRKQVAKSVKSVSPRKQVAKSVKLVSPRKQAAKSAKSVSPRKQAAKSEKKPVEQCEKSAPPPGWRIEIIARKSGTQGSYKHYYSPKTNRMFRSLAAVRRFLAALEETNNDENKAWALISGN